ncbi:NF-kappa-B essential modulator [Culicoides brevitarsis]|uniref:NF-kappa-B essential modulator n=1 Tax=Culicoides brevitarsis TaxID=469753 RepID=UPI00307C167A
MSASTMAMNSLENDDSFVILGSSPPQSFLMEKSTIGTSMSLIPSPTPQAVSIQPENSPKNSLQNGAVGGQENKEKSFQGHSTSTKPVSLDKNFATKVILGQIDPKSMQSSLFEQFPSLNASQVQVDDIMKLSCLVEEHQQLKENLEKTNVSMRRQFTVLQEWQDTVKRRLREKNDEIEKLKKDLTTSQNTNDRLTQDLAELKHKYDETVAQFSAFQVSAKKEIADMTMAVSEKDAIIKNIHAENERLQLEKADFVVLKNNKPEPAVDPVDFVRKTEHEAKMREMRHQLNELAAKNLEFEDMRKTYTDELSCLKVNLTAAEELHRDMRDTITTLRLRDDETRKRMDETTTQLQQMQDENALLKVQVEVYQKDFLMEREAREKLVTEKENILSELQLLKMRNKQLIDHEQERLSNENGGPSTPQQPPTDSTSTGATRKSKSKSPESDSLPIRYICPVCNHELKTLRLLEQHIDICLKD